MQGDDQTWSFTFPRQENPPRLCIADYFKTEEDGGDLLPCFVVTLGDVVGQLATELYEKDAYHDYLMLHGFGVELTDALAEYWHEIVRSELGIEDGEAKEARDYVHQQYRGSRYAFGYPACPNLDDHEPLFEMLDPARIGVTLTSTMEMVPEQTTSAIILHHPQAKYFSV